MLYPLIFIMFLALSLHLILPLCCFRFLILVFLLFPHRFLLLFPLSLLRSLPLFGGDSVSLSCPSCFCASLFSSSVVPSVLSAPLPPAPPLTLSSSFSTGPPPGFSSSVSFLSSAPSFPPGPSFAPWFSAPSTSWSSLPSSASSSVPSSLDFCPVSSSSVSSPSLDFVAYQANVLGLSAEYRVLGRWYFASGGKDFPAYLSAHFPHLYSDFRLDFSSGSSRVLSALLSAPPLVQLPAAPTPAPLASSSSLLPSSSVTSSSFASVSAFLVLLFLSLCLRWLRLLLLLFLLRLRFSLTLQGFTLCSLPLPILCALLRVFLRSLRWVLRCLWGWGLLWVRFPRVRPRSRLLSFFCPFVSSSASSSVPSAPSAPPLSSSSAGFLLCTSSFYQPAPSLDPAVSFEFASAEDLPEDSPPDAVPRVLDPGFAAVPEAVRSEFRRMLAFIVYLFPQAAGFPSVPPPPRAFFEDFFSSSTPSCASLIYLNWFERVQSALSDADSRLSCFVAFGRGDFLLPSRSPVYTVQWGFALGGAAPVNPSVLSLLDRRLKPSHHVGLSIREAAALEGSLRSQLEAFVPLDVGFVSLLAFVRLQHFAPEDATLFNTLVTSLSKSLAHQANLPVTHTAFLGLKRRQFFLSHLPSYFSEVSKRAMLSSPVVLAYSLFAEEDVTCLLAETQTSSSLRSQQALVVVSRGSGARFRSSSPGHSPSRASSSRRRRRDSGSPSRPQKCIRFDSPAPSSALRGSGSGFRK